MTAISNEPGFVTGEDGASMGGMEARRGDREVTQRVVGLRPGRSHFDLGCGRRRPRVVLAMTKAHQRDKRMVA